MKISTNFKSYFLKLIELFKFARHTQSKAQSHPDIRESMTHIGSKLPRSGYLFVQQLLTEITGKAPSSLPPLIKVTQLLRQIMTLTFLTTGIWLTSLFLEFGLLLFPIWIIAVLLISASMRTMQVSFTHYAAHGTLHRNKWVNRVLGEAYSILSLSTPMWMYKLSHIGGHHGRLNSIADPDASFFDKWGYQAGRSISWYWLHTIKLIVSPSYYTKLFAERARANFAPFTVEPGLTSMMPTKRSIRTRQWAAIGFHSVLPVIAIEFGFGLLYLMGYLLPLVFGFGVLSLFQNLSEHQPALVPGQNPMLKAETKFTAGRFFGKEYDSNAPIKWWAYMLFVAAPSKYLVVGNTELCSHDVHHAAEVRFFSVSDKEWANAPYVRRDAVNQGAVFKENWGIKDTIEHSFIALKSIR
ncbi:hypothetical protein N474_09555 [Pseudoalteromonas luteoviolacea CPMOR-2]|uniref:fatty acid desaturase n=1 Tax=Pseudoalteromonas luteoviolacea TaxID=43657 RepID=UPI0007B09FC6|nr:fatty acid desaturase [Pseudoalteromonas luteoviolacea]KZN56856.1 hypothetical protein N474_09555 [Pseudoalteromonas luteoviolacea CPMOR-2]